MKLTPGIRLFAALLLTFAGSLGISGQSGRVQPTPTPPPRDDTFRVHTEEIKLNVLAFDENGKFFGDVTAGDLVITENDVLHQPSSVRRIPANVLIVMDTGGELRFIKSLERTRKLAHAVVDALRPGDSVALLQYSDKAEIVQEWTIDRGQMTAAIKRTNFGKRSAFVESLILARSFLMKSGLDNKHLVLITDGTDSSATPSAKFDAMQALLATDVSIHVLSYTSMEAEDIEPRTKGQSKTPPKAALPPEVQAQLPNGVKNQGVKVGPTINLDRTLIRRMKARKLDLETSEKELDKLAANSNGEFILPITYEEMLEKAPNVARMIDAAYSVTYMPKIPVVDTRGIAERKIEVTSKRDGLIVQARRKLLIATR